MYFGLDNSDLLVTLNKRAINIYTLKSFSTLYILREYPVVPV